MLRLCVALGCLLWMNSIGQSVEKLIEKINTRDEANRFIWSNSSIQAELMDMSSVRDTTGLSPRFYDMAKGEVIKDQSSIYKIIESRDVNALRASYIYFDGSKLTRQYIDSLRALVIDEYKKGLSFADLFNKYNMDNSPTHGDLGWFTDGMMVIEFESEVRRHKKGDVFTVDVPANKWFYVTIKTHDTRNAKTVTVLKIKRD